MWRNRPQSLGSSRALFYKYKLRIALAKQKEREAILQLSRRLPVTHENVWLSDSSSESEDDHEVEMVDGIPSSDVTLRQTAVEQCAHEGDIEANAVDGFKVEASAADVQKYPNSTGQAKASTAIPAVGLPPDERAAKGSNSDHPDVQVSSLEVAMARGEHYTASAASEVASERQANNTQETPVEISRCETFAQDKAKEEVPQEITSDLLVSIPKRSASEGHTTTLDKRFNLAEHRAGISSERPSYTQNDVVVDGSPISYQSAFDSIVQMYSESIKRAGHAQEEGEEGGCEDEAGPSAQFLLGALRDTVSTVQEAAVTGNSELLSTIETMLVAISTDSHDRRQIRLGESPVHEWGELLTRLCEASILANVTTEFKVLVWRTVYSVLQLVEGAAELMNPSRILQIIGEMARSSFNTVESQIATTERDEHATALAQEVAPFLLLCYHHKAFAESYMINNLREDVDQTDGLLRLLTRLLVSEGAEGVGRLSKILKALVSATACDKSSASISLFLCHFLRDGLKRSNIDAITNSLSFLLYLCVSEDASSMCIDCMEREGVAVLLESIITTTEDSHLVRFALKLCTAVLSLRPALIASLGQVTFIARVLRRFASAEAVVVNALELTDALLNTENIGPMLRRDGVIAALMECARELGQSEEFIRALIEVLKSIVADGENSWPQMENEFDSSTFVAVCLSISDGELLSEAADVMSGLCEVEKRCGDLLDKGAIMLAKRLLDITAAAPEMVAPAVSLLVHFSALEGKEDVLVESGVIDSLLFQMNRNADVARILSAAAEALYNLAVNERTRRTLRSKNCHGIVRELAQCTSDEEAKHDLNEALSALQAS